MSPTLGSFHYRLQRMPRRACPAGLFSFTTPMTDDDLTLLRCPLDPKRESGLVREREHLRCVRCSTTFPIKNGLPILLADEAELPAEVTNRRELPCHRSSRTR